MLWLWLLLCCRPGPTADPTPQPQPRQTVVLVTLDTTRADHLGCYGHSKARTPNLDALAARGLRFDSAWTSVPLTIPAHSSLFTGLWPPRHGVRDNGDQRLSADAVTLAERLQAAGWRTHASVGAFVTQAHWGFGQGFDGYDDDLSVPSDRLGWAVERPASKVIDDALAAWSSGVDFMWVHLFDAHSPYRAPEPFRSQMADRPYDAEIAWVDQQLGRLLQVLPSDAVILVVGDHGEGLGEGEAEHGLLVERSTTRIPMILVAPGLEPGVVQRPVSLVDVTPTLLRLVGLPVPSDLDGQDLVLERPRVGVYSESRYGYHHFGFTPIEVLRGPDGEVMRGARVDSTGQNPEALLAELDRITLLSPAFEAGSSTLDSSTLAQLQALGYVAAGSPTEAGLDPREGVLLLGKMAELRQLPADKQEEALRALLSANPGLREVRMRLGMLLLRSGRPEEGLSELTRCFQESPSSTGAMVLGEGWMSLGDANEALGWYTEALRQDPRSIDARAGQIQALTLLGQLDEASDLVDEALRLAPDHADLLIAAALLAQTRGDPPGALLGEINTIAQRAPGTPNIFLVLAGLRESAGDVLGAEEALREELSFRPYSALARVQLARLLMEQKRLMEAFKVVRPLLALAPKDPGVNALAAEILLAMGRADMAAPHLALCAGTPGCPDAAPSAGE